MKRQTTKRMLITLPESMYNALARQSDQREVPMAAIIRFAIEQLMEAWGEDIRDDVLWGGARYIPKRSSDDDASPEGLGMLRVSA